MAVAAAHRASVPTHDCESCGGPIEGYDSHCLCIPCLGFHHAVTAVSNPRYCQICADWSLARLHKRVAVASTFVALGELSPVSFGAPGAEALEPRVERAQRASHAGHSSSSPRHSSRSHGMHAERMPLAGPSSASHHHGRSRGHVPRDRSSSPQHTRGRHASRARHECTVPSLLIPDSDMDLDDELPSHQPDVAMSSPSPTPAPRTAEMGSQSLPDDASSCSSDEDDGSSVAPAGSHYAASGVSSVPASSASESGIGVEKKKLSVSTVFRRAVSRCGLTFGGEYTADCDAQSSKSTRMVGVAIPVVKPRPKVFKKLPVATGLKEALTDGMILHGKDPPALKFPTEMEEWGVLGLDKLPRISPELAGCFARMVKDGNKPPVPFNLTTDPPSFTDPATAAASKLNQTIFTRAAHPVRYCNASALLLASLHHLLSEAEGAPAASAELIQEATKIKELLATLNEQTTQWLGFMIGSCARQERDRWTAPLEFSASPGLKNRLRHLEISPTDLFPTGYELLKRHTDAVEVREKMVAAVTDKVPSTPSPAPKAKKAGRRSAGSSAERPATASLASTPPTPEAGRGRAAAAVPKDDPNFLKPDPPRSTGRGRGGKRGK